MGRPAEREHRIADRSGPANAGTGEAAAADRRVDERHQAQDHRAAAGASGWVPGPAVCAGRPKHANDRGGDRHTGPGNPQNRGLAL